MGSSSAIISPWHDLVFHTLSCVPANAQDRASLYDFPYVQWTQRHWPKGYTSIGGLAERLGAVCARSRKCFLLQGFAILWDDLDGFLSDHDRAFEQLHWVDADCNSLAALIRAELAPEAVTLLRAAILAQVQAGFLDHWRTRVEPRTKIFAERFARQVSALAVGLPALLRVRWILSHPLRARGRLLGLRRCSPLICVGVGDPELGVSDTHPVIQGCHEYFLSLLPAEHISVNDSATTPGSEGFERFEAAETQALCRGQEFFAQSEWKVAHDEWLTLSAAALTTVDAVLRSSISTEKTVPGSASATDADCRVGTLQGK